MAVLVVNPEPFTQPAARSSRFQTLWNAAGLETEVPSCIPRDFRSGEPALISNAPPDASLKSPRTSWTISERVAEGREETWRLRLGFRSLAAVEGHVAVRLEAGASLTLILAGEKSEPELSLNHYRFELEPRSALRVFMLHSQGAAAGSSRDEFQFHLNGEASSAALHTLDLLDGHSVREFLSEAHHRAPQTRSEQTSRSLIKHSAELDWESLVRIHEAASRSVSRQLSKNLLMTPGARALARPRLQIRNTAVDARHGAATGHLRDDEVFYLRTRGLPADLARQIVAEGFAREWLGAVPQEHRLGALSELFEQALASFFKDAQTWTSS